MKRKNITSFILMAIFALSACSEQAKDVPVVTPSVRESPVATENVAESPIQAEPKTIGTLISDQSFDIELDSWGKVRFASFAPEIDLAAAGLKPDIRFYLMDNENVLYEFPGWNEEHTNSDAFIGVSAIAFDDYNLDGLQDVIALCEYEAMSGEGFQIARIYYQLPDKAGFEEDTLLTEYLSKQFKTDSIADIMSVRDEYRAYRASINGQSGVYEQLEIMAKNKDLWTSDLEYADEVYIYAVADLDRNGRYELIVSNMGGTGIYTYSRFFEINESYDGLVECETGFPEGDSQPDLICDALTHYVDSEGNFYYAVNDYIRNGAAEHYENVRSLSLENGKIVTASIANKATIYDENGNPRTTCTDRNGNMISESEYGAAAENYFSNHNAGVTRLGWQDVRALMQDVNEIVTQLDSSLNIFLYS